MLTKAIIIAVMIIILVILGSGLYYLISDKGNSNRTVKALSWRIGLSLTLFLFLLIAFSMGWIEPHAV